MIVIGGLIFLAFKLKGGVGGVVLKGRAAAATPAVAVDMKSAAAEAI